MFLNHLKWCSLQKRIYRAEKLCQLVLPIENASTTFKSLKHVEKSDNQNSKINLLHSGMR